MKSDQVDSIFVPSLRECFNYLDVNCIILNFKFQIIFRFKFLFCLLFFPLFFFSVLSFFLSFFFLLEITEFRHFFSLCILSSHSMIFVDFFWFSLIFVYSLPRWAINKYNSYQKVVTLDTTPNSFALYTVCCHMCEKNKWFVYLFAYLQFGKLLCYLETSEKVSRSFYPRKIVPP